MDTKIDINAVKAGFKVVSMKNGVVEVTPSSNPDFLSFLSPSSETFAIIQVPDLSKSTSPASSILRVLNKAHAMGLKYSFPTMSQLAQFATDGVLSRMKLDCCVVAIFEKLPYEFRCVLEELGLVLCEVKDENGDVKVEMRFVSKCQTDKSCLH